MKIVNRKTFLQMPSGTIFAKGNKWFFESLCIKGDSLHNDFYCLDPAWIDSEDDRQQFDRLDEMLSTGCSFPIESSESRDGLFDDDALFLIFELDDLLVMKKHIELAIGVVSGA